MSIIDALEIIDVNNQQCPAVRYRMHYRCLVKKASPIEYARHVVIRRLLPEPGVGEEKSFYAPLLVFQLAEKYKGQSVPLLPTG